MTVVITVRSPFRTPMSIRSAAAGAGRGELGAATDGSMGVPFRFVAVVRQSCGFAATACVPLCTLCITAIALHVLCGSGIALLGRAPVLLPRRLESGSDASIRDTLLTPYVRTIAVFVVLTTASSAILDFLLKSHARESFGAGPELLRFFAVFYGTAQVASFLAQTRSGVALQRLGVARAIDALPEGVGAAGIVALLVPRQYGMTGSLS